jgi:hypothetical protein
MKRGGCFLLAALVILQAVFASTVHSSAQELEGTATKTVDGRMPVPAALPAEATGAEPDGTSTQTPAQTPSPDEPTDVPESTQTPPDHTTETPTPTDTPLPIPTGSSITPAETPTSTMTETETVTPTLTPTADGTATKSLTPSITETETGTPTPTPTTDGTATETPTQTPTETPTATPTPASSGRILISEVAWAGTAASSSDEWIELWNPGSGSVSLDGWILTDGGDIRIYLSGSLDGGAFFLLERTDDTTVRDIAADIVYSGALSNSGEILSLRDSAGRLIDTANADGGFWPAGSTAGYATMERAGDFEGEAWCTNAGVVRNGIDAQGNPIRGTPHQGFSGLCGTPTPSPTPSPTPTIPGREYPPFAVLINEVAWAGTAADSGDEWIELFNPGGDDIPLDGWRLTDDGDIHIALGGSIPGGGFFLLERGDDNTVSDIPADQIYSGNLSNSGERLRLIDPSGHTVDDIGAGGAGWAGGSASPAYASMERAGAGWITNTGWVRNGRDARGLDLRGTPRRPNSALFPTPTATALPRGVLINEFLPKPGSDWNGDGVANLEDEFIELINTGTVPVDLSGWKLDDKLNGGSRPYKIPNGVVIQPGKLWVFFRKKTNISLGDSGDEVWLLAPDGRKMDGAVYTKTRWPDSAWNRFPDGESVLRLGFPPTPGERNRLPPALLITPTRTPAPVLAGWREADCSIGAGPILLGEGVLTTGEESSIQMAEITGWLAWEQGACFAWAAPRAYGGDLSASPAVGDLHDPGAGWWWEPRFIR